MSKNEVTISKLRFQVSLLRELVIIFDKALSELCRKPTPKLPLIVYEDIE